MGSLSHIFQVHHLAQCILNLFLGKLKQIPPSHISKYRTLLVLHT